MSAGYVDQKYKLNHMKAITILFVVVLILASVVYIGIKLDPDNKMVSSHPTFIHVIHLRPGDTARIALTDLPIDLWLKGHNLYSSNLSVVSFDSDGKLIAQGIGAAELYYADKNLRFLVSRISVREKKTIYLTFDDGPSTSITPLMLDVLDKYNIKATFFVVGQYVSYYPDILKEIHDRGHSIGIHSNTHEYGLIYNSSATLLGDVASLESKVAKITGETTDLYRFPGGSFEAKQTLGAEGYDTFVTEIHNRGYRIFDWTCSLGDTSPKLNTSDALYKSALKRFSNNNYVIFLAHDIGNKRNTPEAIDMLIQHFISEGYVFDVLENYPGELIYR